MAHFEVGKKVIAIKNHSDDLFRKGDIFRLRSIREAYCNCSFVLLDVGIIPLNSGGMYCTICGTGYPKNGKYGWYKSTSFAPLDDMQTELSEVTEASVDEIINEPQTITI